MNSTRDQVRIAVASQAAEWFVANQGPAADYARRAEFVAWLKASPMHIEEYLGVAVLARDLREVADEADMPLESLLEQARADDAEQVVPIIPSLYRQARTRPDTGVSRWPAWAAAAAMIALAVPIVWWGLTDRPVAPAQWYRTQHGEQATQQLADGSRLHLNTDTAVEVTFNDDVRRLRIASGQALFQVAHGDPRPFRVTAGDVEIVAVGTEFDVRQKGRSTVVTVVEGQVDVVAAPARETRRVPAGHRLRIDDGVMPVQSEPVDARAAVAWLQRQIIFEHQPLGDVADEFNRYGAVQITIGDTGLRALPVSGVFNAYDTDSFVAFIESLEGVRVERMPTRIIVMKQDATNLGETPGEP